MAWRHARVMTRPSLQSFLQLLGVFYLQSKYRPIVFLSLACISRSCSIGICAPLHPNFPSKDFNLSFSSLIYFHRFCVMLCSVTWPKMGTNVRIITSWSLEWCFWPSPAIPLGNMMPATMEHWRWVFMFSAHSFNRNCPFPSITCRLHEMVTSQRR